VALRSYLFSHSLEVLDENHVLVAAGDRTHAGILVPLYEDERGALRVLLTERSAELNSHGGEVAFPGGKTDEGEDDLDAAVREGA
jgi:8-oxo-dGTP pyrophosphatase MutT (NUDIX family)